MTERKDLFHKIWDLQQNATVRLEKKRTIETLFGFCEHSKKLSEIFLKLVGISAICFVTFVADRKSVV